MDETKEKQGKTVKQARKIIPKKNAEITPKNKAKASWWSVAGRAILLLTWTLVSVIAAQFLFSYIFVMLLSEEQLESPAWNAIYSAVTYTFALILAILVPRLVEKRRKTLKPGERERLGLRGLPTWTDIGLAPAGFVVYLILAGIVTAIFMVFPWFDAEQTQELGFSTYIVGLDRVWAFLAMVVIAPIAEEIIFRGWLYGRMRSELLKKMPDWASMAVSIFLVSVLFGIVHGQWNVGVNVFAMSIILCALREITGTIYAGILLHMLKNGVAFYLLYVVGIF